MHDAHMMQKFAKEAREHLSGIETSLHQLRTNGTVIDNDLVNSVMKSVRSIESSAKLLGFVQINSLSHRLENVLAALRDNKLIPSLANFVIILASTQRLRLLVDSIETSDQTNNSKHFAELDQLLAASAGKGKSNTARTAAKKARQSAVPRAKSATTGPRPKAKPSVATTIEGSLDEIIDLLDSAITDVGNSLEKPIVSKSRIDGSSTNIHHCDIPNVDGQDPDQ
ncbi:Hpt domain-containing protein [Rubripirellula reticaptiva]|uniref:Chemotaxis protein CheA n=1 Tax=Rubripirellula reticaptiva TaxID=2528013 RepID=A0A5C6EV42_9BACT|nr:Hpt domain-containing protein [Rubripirellula reticaptiva]TWU51339.1 Chemotaxis protein CheA [Rubripirellula reticaptiva]